MADSSAVSEAADRLYSAGPEEFVALRAELAKAADGDDAKAIKALRKPTVSASVVNRYVQSDPDVVGRLTGLGDRLRQATTNLDAAQLRELSTERRTLVADTTRAAFAHVGSDDPPAAQRDEVNASFDAAVADPQIAQQLGRLVRPARFDGFGVVPGPELTLVQGGRKSGGRKPARASKPATTKSAAKPATTKPAAETSPESKPPGKDSPTTRRLQRAAAKARDAFEHADTSYDAATAAERTAHERVSALTNELKQLQRELDEAKRDLDRARKTTRAAKTERRTTRSALDKAERQLET